MREGLGIVAYKGVELLTRAALIQTCVAEFLRTGFEAFDVDVETRKKQTTLMWSIVAGAMSLSAGMTVASHAGLNERKMEDTFFATVSAPFLFFIAEALGGPEAVSLPVFVGLTVFSWVAAYIFYKKTNVEEVAPAEDIEAPREIVLMPELDHPEENRVERYVNVLRFAQMSAFSFSAGLELFIREKERKTEPLPLPGYIMLLNLVVASSIGGGLLTRQTAAERSPLAFTAYLFEWLEAFSLIYSALSGILFLSVTKDTIDKNQYSLIGGCFTLAFWSAIFRVVRSHFDVLENHRENIALIQAARAVPEWLAEKRTSAVESCEQLGARLSLCRQRFVGCFARISEEEARLADDAEVVTALV